MSLGESSPKKGGPGTARRAPPLRGPALSRERERAGSKRRRIPMSLDRTQERKHAKQISLRSSGSFAFPPMLPSLKTVVKEGAIRRFLPANVPRARASSSGRAAGSALKPSHVQTGKSSSNNFVVLLLQRLLTRPAHDRAPKKFYIFLYKIISYPATVSGFMLNLRHKRL